MAVPAVGRRSEDKYRRIMPEFGRVLWTIADTFLSLKQCIQYPGLTMEEKIGTLLTEICICPNF